MTARLSGRDGMKDAADEAAAASLASLLESKQCLPQAIHKLAEALQAVAGAQSLDPAVHPRAYQGGIPSAISRMREAEVALAEAIDHAHRAQRD